MSSQPWFVPRRIGIGWRPATWEGWVITAIMAVTAVAGLVAARISRTPVLIVAVVAVVAVYTVIAALTARPPAAPPEREPASPSAPAAAPPLAAASERTTRTAPAAGPPALAVEGLTKRFRERVAFQDVTFTVGGGEVFGFLGPNGAGKTTTVRTLGTLLAPSAGSATVAGIPLTSHNGEAIRRRIAIMPESPGLYLRLSVRENLEYFAGLFTLSDRRTRIDEALAAVNLGSRADDLCGSLSKGLRQRVGLARALLSDPQILFLDEPTSGLDPVATREVHDLIESLRSRGVTVFLTTHRLDEAERLCDRVAILNTTLRMVGRPDELRARLFSAGLAIVTAAPLAAPETLFASIAGIQRWDSSGPGRYALTVSDPKAVAPALTRALVAAGADVESLGETRHSLEDVYLELIADDVEVSTR